MKLFNKVAAIAVGVMLATGVGAGIVLGSRNVVKAEAATGSVNVSSSSLATANGWTASAGTSIGTIFSSVDLDDYISVSFAGTGNTASYWSNGSDIRIYGTKNTSDASITFTGASGVTITSVTLTFTLSNSPSFSPSITSDTALSINKNSQTITMTSGSKNGQIKITNFNVSYSYTGATTYSVSYNANATTNVGGTLPSAHTGLANNTTQTLSVTGPTRWGYTFGGWAASPESTTPISSVTINGANVTVYAIWNANLTVAGAHASNPYTVAQARTAIDDGDHLDENYVSGIISQVDSYNSTYHSITYWISDDGTTTNQLEVYSGKGLNGADFSSVDDVETGATVVVCGTLKKYNSTYEFNQTSKQVSYTAPVVATTYDVTFDANGGTNPDAKEVGEGLTFHFPSPGTVANNIFKGWSSNNVNFYQEGDTSPAVTADIEYTGYWQTKGTSANPYSVAEAMAAIDANTGIKGAHVSGIVSQVDSYSNNAVTYWISDDGTTTTQLEIYHGKGLNNANFSSKDDVEVGAEVVVVGNLKKYNTTYEFDSGSYQVSYDVPTPETYTVTYTAGTNGTGSFAHENQPAGSYSLLPFASLTGISASSGYRFKSYTVDGVERDPGYVLTLSAAKSVTVNFEEGVADSTASTTVAAYATANSWVNQTQYLTMELDSYVTLTVDGGGNSGKYYSNDSSWRLYSSETATLTISVPAGSTLTSATLTFPATDSPTVTFNSNDVTSGTAVSLSGTSAEFSVDAGKLHLTDISVSYVPGVLTTYTITYDNNGGNGTMSDTVGTAPEVASCTFTAPAGKMFSRWNTAADGNGDDYKPGDVADQDLDLYAIWVTEIGEDITMTPGTSASNVHIVTTTSKTRDAVKCGGSSSAGDMTLTLKTSGITKIKVYVAGWNNDTGKDIDVSISNGSISPTSISVTADSGISGSGSTFDLSASESTYRFEFTLTNAPADAEITLTAHNASKNRFVVWGATDQFAETFASKFNSNLTCNANGTSQPTYSNGYSWAELENQFDALDEEEQGILRSASANQSGTTVEQAMARYDYIVGKYLKGQGLTAYKDFIARNPATIGASRVIKTVDSESATAAAMVVVVVSAVSVTAIGGFFLLKKKPF